MSRHDRRADPDQWYRISAASLDPSDRPAEIPPDKAAYFKGPIDKLLVFSIPTEIPTQQRIGLMQGIREFAEANGVEAMVLDDTIKICALRKVDDHTAKLLERDRRLRATERAAAVAAHEKPKGPPS